MTSDHSSDYSDSESSDYEETPRAALPEERATGEVVIEKTLSVKEQVKNLAHLKLQEILAPRSYFPLSTTEQTNTTAPPVENSYDYSVAYNAEEHEEYTDEESESEEGTNNHLKAHDNSYMAADSASSIGDEEEIEVETPIAKKEEPFLTQTHLLQEDDEPLEYVPYIRSKEPSVEAKSLNKTMDLVNEMSSTLLENQQVSQPVNNSNTLTQVDQKPNLPNAEVQEVISPNRVQVETNKQDSLRKDSSEAFELVQEMKRKIEPTPSEVNPTQVFSNTIHQIQYRPKQQAIDPVRPKSDVHLPKTARFSDTIQERDDAEVIMRPSITNIDTGNNMAATTRRRQWRPFSSFNKDNEKETKVKKSEPNIYFGDEIINRTPGPASSISLRRTQSDRQWGFTVHGGWEFGSSPFISQVMKNSLSHQAGVEVGDIIETICGKSTYGKDSNQIKAEILRAGNDLDLILTKNGINMERLYAILPKLRESNKISMPQRSKSLIVRRMDPNNKSLPIVNTKSIRILESQLAPDSQMYARAPQRIVVQPIIGTNNSQFHPNMTGNYPSLTQARINPLHNTTTNTWNMQSKTQPISRKIIPMTMIQNRPSESNYFPAYPCNQDSFQTFSAGPTPVNVAGNQFNNLGYGKPIVQYQKMNEPPRNQYHTITQQNVIKARPHTSSLQFELYAHR